jgi:hypothetical protein
VGHCYGRMVPGTSVRVAGEPAAGMVGRRLFFVASCVSNQFDLLGIRYAVFRDLGCGCALPSFRIARDLTHANTLTEHLVC